MRAHCIGPQRDHSSSSSRTLICNMLRFSDRDRILQAAQCSPLKLGGKDILFSSFQQTTLTTLTTWSLVVANSPYPSRQRGSWDSRCSCCTLPGWNWFGDPRHVLNTHQEAEDFINRQGENEDWWQSVDSTTLSPSYSTRTFIFLFFSLVDEWAPTSKCVGTVSRVLFILRS